VQTTEFIAKARGVGRKDYSKLIEYSVTPYITPTRTQSWLRVHSIYNLMYIPFPNSWEVLLPMVQPGGTWDWLASYIPSAYYNLELITNTNSLCYLAYQSYASIADYFADIIHQRIGETFGYGGAKILWPKGAVTQEGYLYSVRFVAWNDEVARQVQGITMLGMVTELAQLAH